MEQHYKYTGYAVPCPFCGHAVRAYLPAPEMTTIVTTLQHDLDFCRDFWDSRDNEIFLEGLRSKLVVWPEDKPMGIK